MKTLSRSFAQCFVIVQCFVIALILLLAACAAPSPTPNAAPTDTSLPASPTASVAPSATLLPTVTQTATPIPTATPTLSPTPYPVERLAFVEMNNPEGYDPFIALINSDGSGYEKLDFTAGYIHDSDRGAETGSYLAISPNGRYLAFNGYNETAARCGEGAYTCFAPNAGVIVADLETRTIVTLTKAVSGGFSWSPDSAQLVFLDRVELADEQGLFHSKTNLFVLNIETGEKRQLLQNFSDDGEPAWSPDGQWIAFLRSVPDIPSCWGEASCENSLYIIHPDGSGLTRLVENVFHHYTSGIAPVWSPDGQWLAVMSKEESIFDRKPILVNVNTGEVRRLNFDAWHTPRWFPDGNRLLLCNGEQDATDIYSLEWGENQPLNLSNHPSYDCFPIASPSGNFVAFLSGRDAKSPYLFHGLSVIHFDGSAFKSLGVLAKRFVWLPNIP
jgi:Tol biopolymer transport system component